MRDRRQLVHGRAEARGVSCSLRAPAGQLRRRRLRCNAVAQPPRHAWRRGAPYRGEAHSRDVLAGWPQLLIVHLRVGNHHDASSRR
eukprot:6669504-Pyramimonas_sp.AAC.1